MGKEATGGRRSGTSVLAALSVVLSALIGAGTNIVTQNRTVTLIVTVCLLVAVAAGVAWADSRARTREATAPEPLAMLSVEHAPVDWRWAQWTRSELVSAGVNAQLRELPDARPGTIVVSAQPPASRRWSAKSYSNRLVVRVGAGWGSGTPENETLNLVGLPEERSRDALFTAIGRLHGVAVREPATGPGISRRFPGAWPRVWKMPPRNPVFVGRAAVIGELHERLAAGVTAVVPEALYGLGGVGKTQIAVEYAYRFAAEFDLVWWVPAEHPSLVRESLTSLAEHLGIAAAADAQRTELVLDALRQGQPYGRWLLIYDNAEEPAAIRDLMPQHGAGQLLITSRNHGWGQYIDALELRVFDRDESVALLRRRMPDLEDDAGKIADLLGDLPLAIDQASSWLASTAMPVQQYLELLDTAPVRLLEESPPVDYGRAISATWLLALQRMRAERPVAASLLELCACMAPEPIPIRMLLESEHCLAALADLEPGIRGPISQGRAIQEIAGSALARLHPKHQTLQIHRLVQAVILDHLGPDRVTRYRRLACLAFADADPGNPDDAAEWPTYAIALSHVLTCQALEDSEPRVRLLIAGLVRYLRLRGDDRTGVEIARAAIERWQPFGDDDPTTLKVRVELAHLLRMTARYAEAQAINADVLARLSRTGDPNDILTLTVAYGVGADLRVAGDYSAARRLDTDTLERCRRAHGHDHPVTLLTANNLAVSMRLLGEHRAAEELCADTTARQRKRLGETHPTTLFVTSNRGTDLRWLGQLAESRRLLTWSYQQHLDSVGPDHPGTLLARANLAATLRWLAEHELAREFSTTNLAQCRRLLAEGHLYTVLCLSDVAADASFAGAHDQARAAAEEALAVSPLATGHPVSLTLRSNLASVLRHLGNHTAAREMSESAAADLQHRLGASHPFAIAAAVNHADDLAVAGAYGAASQVGEQAYEAARAVLGEEHHHTLIAGGNLATIRQPNSAALRNAVLRTARASLGAQHTVTAAIRTRQRMRIFLEPHLL
ncbi:FxSxx-COOH system tetratricopeptide repeat protein [Actinoplanes sp. NPDC026670]|uniref:FxSxx-COOH system tetratricopeptide repeat protein n=1 Tax=Actinoplanes sp. NPDC026670 TaxID=3154700 RepID=UPI0033E00BB2